ncbi:MAG: sodium:solute symporter family protein [Cyclobacteriaceae bacterium]|nr:sodium:solute symporter family protein [Cyclobacteriaceae bacterium]
MKLATIDILIIVLYLVAIVVIGLLLKKKAQKNKKSYLLGGNQMPWYMLGLSNASGMFDISGTVWLVTILFVYGVKSIWLPWLWPVFNQLFLMVFLSQWLRRSNVTTGAEWIGTRFGYKKSAKLSHIIVVIFAIIMGLGYLTYGFIGLGKFVMIFIPWEFTSQFIPFDIPAEYVPHFYGIIFTCFAVFYSLLGGMMSIVWADVIQYTIMAISSIVIAFIAMTALSENQLVVPDGWTSPFFGWNIDLDWSNIINEVNVKIKEDGFSLFSILFMMMIFKGVLVSLAGPAPTYDMQKILSTKSEREAALMSGSVSVILMPIRYLMIAGFGVLGLLYYDKLNLMVGDRLDFEQILPSAINEFVPVGFLGLLLAGLLAAFMSTFAGTLNAAQAYVVNDIYLKYMNPQADNNKIKNINYVAGLILVVFSIVFGFFAKDVNDVLQWIVGGLYGSYVAANMLKWYWWRFNGNGFFLGMVGGLIPALTFRFIFSGGILDTYTFPLMLLVSVIACLIGVYTAPPVDEDILKAFYKNVRPWGFWGPIRDKVMAEDPTFVPNKNFGRDMFNVFIWYDMANRTCSIANIYCAHGHGSHIDHPCHHRYHHVHPESVVVR